MHLGCASICINVINKMDIDKEANLQKLYIESFLNYYEKKKKNFNASQLMKFNENLP
jgi:hypothetical protein